MIMDVKLTEDMFNGIRHTKYVDVNCAINGSSKTWPLERTMHLDWPPFQIQQSLHKGDSCKWILDLTTKGYKH